MNFTPEQIAKIKEELTAISEHELEERFDEVLFEEYAEVEVCGYTYSASDVFKNHDPIAYRQEFLNWIDTQISNGRFTDEIDGEHYNQEEVDELIEEMEEEDEAND